MDNARSSQPSSKQVIERLQSEFPLEATGRNYLGESAERWRYADGTGEIDVISDVTNASCDDCNRARLSTEGKLFLCLYANQGHELRALHCRRTALFPVATMRAGSR